MKTLLIEPDKEIVENLSMPLELRWPGGTTLTTSKGKEGIEMVVAESPDVVFVDEELPDMNGFEVLRQIRTFSDVPLIAMVSPDKEMNRVKALEAGADEYLVKTPGPLEIIARVNALFRRAAPQLANKHSVYISGKLTVNRATRETLLGDEEIKLTPTEYKLLQYLVQNEGRVVSKQTLGGIVWGPEFWKQSREKELRKYIYRLRCKFKQTPNIIRTESGIGYRFIPPR